MSYPPRGRSQSRYEDDEELPPQRGRSRSQSRYEDEEDYAPRGRNGAPSRSRSRSRSRAPPPPTDDDDALTPEEEQQYQELLAEFGGDEEKLREAVEAFMEEYERNGGQMPGMDGDERR